MVNQKILKSGLVGGLILFVWGMVSWMMLPWNLGQFKPFMNEKVMCSKIQENTPESGLYLMPYYACNKDPNDLNAMKKQMEEGPVVFMAVSKEGAAFSMAGRIIAGLIINIAAASLVSWIIAYARLTESSQVIPLIAVMGVLLGWMAGMPLVVWFNFPLSFALFGVLDSVLGWSFAGFVMTKIMTKP